MSSLSRTQVNFDNRSPVDISYRIKLFFFRSPYSCKVIAFTLLHFALLIFQSFFTFVFLSSFLFLIATSGQFQLDPPSFHLNEIMFS